MTNNNVRIRSASIILSPSRQQSVGTVLNMVSVLMENVNAKMGLWGVDVMLPTVRTTVPTTRM